jgi:hypothetical protein
MTSNPNNIYESLSTHLKNSIRGNESNRILLFDVDDTIVHTTARVGIRHKDGSVTMMDNSDYNDYAMKTGDEFDYTEFNDINILLKDLPTPYFDTLKREYRKGTHIGIITARGDCDMIKKFLRAKGIDIKKELVFAVGDPKLGLSGTIQEKKAEVIDYLIKAGYKTLVFFDDNKLNLEYAKSQERKGVKIIPVHVSS